MSQIESLFVTRLYRSALSEFCKAPDAAELGWTLTEGGDSQLMPNLPY